MISRIVEWRGGMQDGFLCEIEYFGDVEREEGGAFYACFHFLCHVTSAFSLSLISLHTTSGCERKGEVEKRKRTLNSFMMGIISASSASFVTSPPRKSILLPTSMTGTLTPS